MWWFMAATDLKHCGSSSWRWRSWGHPFLSIVQGWCFRGLHWPPQKLLRMGGWNFREAGELDRRADRPCRDRKLGDHGPRTVGACGAPQLRDQTAYVAETFLSSALRLEQCVESKHSSPGARNGHYRWQDSNGARLDAVHMCWPSCERQAFRTDAKCEVGRIVLGGWSLDHGLDTHRPLGSRWKSFPLIYRLCSRMTDLPRGHHLLRSCWHLTLVWLHSSSLKLPGDGIRFVCRSMRALTIRLHLPCLQRGSATSGPCKGCTCR